MGDLSPWFKFLLYQQFSFILKELNSSSNCWLNAYRFEFFIFHFDKKTSENICRHAMAWKRYVPNSKNGRPSEKLCWQGSRCTVSSHIRGERPLHRSDLWLDIAKPWLQIHYMDLLYIVSGDDIMWLPSLDYSLTHGYEMIQKTSSNHDFLEFEMIYNKG